MSPPYNAGKDFSFHQSPPLSKRTTFQADDEPHRDDPDPLAAPPPADVGPVQCGLGPQSGLSLGLQGEADPHHGREQCSVLLLLLPRVPPDQRPGVCWKFHSDLSSVFRAVSRPGRDRAAQTDDRHQPAESLRSIRVLFHHLSSNYIPF